MTETLQRLQSEVAKSPKRVHFEELRPTGTQRYQKSMTTKLRIKAGTQSPSNQHSANQFANKPLFPHNTSRDSSLNLPHQPKKSAMKTISQAIFSSPQQQQKSNGIEVKKTKKSGSKGEEEVVKQKNLTPSIFSNPQQSETDEEEELVVETKTKNSKSKKQPNVKAPSPIEDQSKAMITPSIFSAPSPQKQLEDSSEESEEEIQPKGKNLNKKNSSNAVSPSTNHKIKEEPIVVEKEKDGITHELIKKVAALKPLIDNATSNTNLKSDDSSKNRKGDKSVASKKSSNDREARDDKAKSSKTGSNKSISAKKNAENSNGLEENVDSATAQIILGKMRSNDPVHNALNFSAIQQQQKDTPITTISPATKKSSTKKY